MKILKIIGWLLLTLLLVGVLAGAIYYQVKKPKYQDEITLSGIQKDVEILYDEHGIPHIFAQNEPDAFFALGYCHAKERLFQMEMMRRLACGELCEIVGDKALEVDKYFRTMSFRQHAQKTIQELYTAPDDPTVAVANAYLAGINHFQETGNLPIEFDIMGIKTRPFKLEDCFIVAGYMGLSFCEAFDAEPVNSFILDNFGEDRLRDLVTTWAPDAAKIPVGTDTRELLKLSDGMEKVRSFTRAVPPFHGSNSWILAGSRTRSGKPIFENDTHIGFGQPSVFFEAHLEYPGQSLYGNFIAGAPVPVLGHTAHGAWGLTMFENDDVDFYKETLHPTNQDLVKFRDDWEPIITREEIIKVKGAADVPFKVRRTRHGYLLNDAFKMFENAQSPIAFWWVYHQRSDQSLRAFYQLSKAKNVDAAAEAVRIMHAPGLNVMWADAENNIAWWAAGLLPKRPPHVRPYLILDGASGKDEIEGWLDFSQNPQSVNPASGFVFTANNQPDAMPGQALVPGYYVPEDRARRIRELFLNDSKDWTAEAVQAAANDHLNPVLPEALQSIVPILENAAQTENEKIALEILKKWDGSHPLDATAPTIFYRWLYYFYQKTFGDELASPDAMRHFLKSHTLKRTFAVLVKNDQSEWWDDVRTPNQRETRSEIFAACFHAAISDLEKELGKQPTSWQWEKVHTLTHNHPLSVVPGLGKYFNVGPLAVPGGKETVSNFDFTMDSTLKCKVTYGPALRRILDFSARENAMSINPTGQSGNIGSPFYDDQSKLFAQGKFRHEYTKREDILKVKTSTFWLRAK